MTSKTTSSYWDGPQILVIYHTEITNTYAWKADKHQHGTNHSRHGVWKKMKNKLMNQNQSDMVFPWCLLCGRWNSERHRSCISLPYTLKLTWCHFGEIFSSLVALDVVKITTSSAAIDEKFVEISAFVFQWKKFPLWWWYWKIPR